MAVQAQNSGLAGVQWRPILLISFMFAIVGFGFSVSVAAQLRLLEDIICTAYYEKNSPIAIEGSGVQEDICKTTEIQEVLAQVLGWQSFFENVPGLVLAMPYGVIADKYGRKAVLVASMSGMFLSSIWVLFVCWSGLPIRLIWLSNMFVCIGGGGTVTVAISMTIIADATPEAQRSRVTFYCEAMSIAAAMVAPAIGALLMEVDLWIPLLLQLACSAIAVIIAISTPETQSRACKLRKSTKLSMEQIKDAEADDFPTSSKQAKNALVLLARHCASTASFVAHDRNVMFIVLSFLFNEFGRQSLTFLLQYVSKRYGWSVANASYLLSLRGAAQLAFVLILPILDIFLVEWLKITAQAKNLFLARISAVLLTASFAAMAFSGEVWLVVIGLALYTLGNGFGIFARSLVSSLVHPDMIGTLYTSISVMDATGALLAGPLIAKAFNFGLHLGGMWLGMPYVLSTVLLALCTMLLFGVKLRVVSGDHVDEFTPILSQERRTREITPYGDDDEAA